MVTRDRHPISDPPRWSVDSLKRVHGTRRQVLRRWKGEFRSFFAAVVDSQDLSATAMRGISPTRATGMHALRHFFASMLLDAGVSITVVAEYLGHSDPAQPERS